MVWRACRVGAGALGDIEWIAKALAICPCSTESGRRIICRRHTTFRRKMDNRQLFLPQFFTGII
jgi:hypothetical protein